MTAPTNLNFATPGPAPGTADGWRVNIQNAGVVVADYRGTSPAPSAVEGFGRDWSNNQNWSPTIALAQPTLFDRPARPAGVDHEDFGFNWSNFPAMSAGAPDPAWPAPATGFCNVFVPVVDPATNAGYASPEAPLGTPISNTRDDATRSDEEFDLGWGTTPPTPNAIVGSTATNPITVVLSSPHGIAVGDHFPVFIYGHLTNTAANGLWHDVTAAADPNQLTLPALGNAVGGATGFLVLQTNFAPTPPPSWTTNTAYDVSDVVLSSGNWYAVSAVMGTGTSGAVTGPSGTADFVDDPGPNQITWTFLRVAPENFARYASAAAMYDAGSFAYEDFGSGWSNVPYYSTIPSSATATYHGWDAILVAAIDVHPYEDFYQVLANPLRIALVDAGPPSLISLAPGLSALDGLRARFLATPPFAAYGSTYPSPVVPGASYIFWNATPALGLERMNIGDPGFAEPLSILSSTGTGPINIQTATPHNLNNGDIVFVYGHLVNTVIDGFHVVYGVVDATHFEINLSSGLSGGATGTAYGPITQVAFGLLSNIGQLELELDPVWDWLPKGG